MRAGGLLRDQAACLTFPEALRLCRYAADYERRGGPAGGRPVRTPARGSSPAGEAGVAMSDRNINEKRKTNDER